VQQRGDGGVLVRALFGHHRRDGEQVRDVGNRRALASLLAVDFVGERDCRRESRPHQGAASVRVS
jgi:hypothetical protein